MCFSYLCDEYVLNDTAKGDLKILRAAISALAGPQEMEPRDKKLFRSQSFAGTTVKTR